MCKCVWLLHVRNLFPNVFSNTQVCKTLFAEVSFHYNNNFSQAKFGLDVRVVKVPCSSSYTEDFAEFSFTSTRESIAYIRKQNSVVLTESTN